MPDLLQELKGRLKITWDLEDYTLQQSLNLGKQHFDRLTGVKLDFSVDDEPKRLLLEYCRYDYNNAAEYFKDHYQSDILNLQFMAALGRLPEVADDEG